ncbi:ArsR family transcriptional regulator [Saccharopolyspora indica]|uniref:helix-turn-helix transcriptional regulator n=1 Tax=Saccharopolyspora indica TaxID=1229659 RepID=UPI0022EB0D23|nr:helix-turn-helix transcriptional regulator [Saccharopolyspora indica]MDA3644184.1 helix-turn-helix transcriptional regulator [Saccharopolyspora indica]
MSAPHTAVPTNPVTTAETMRLHCLHVLRIAGFASPNAVAGFTGLDISTVEAELDTATEAELCVRREGRIAGYALTPAGRAWHAEELAAELERLGGRSAVEAADAAFVELNGPFKQLCTDWQVRDGAPNDHDDPHYDRQIFDRLAELHPAAVRLTTELTRAVPRYGWYPPRLENAWRRIDSGEARAFTAPMADSYHDTWMALHQDLMSTLGRQRSANDGH